MHHGDHEAINFIMIISFDMPYFITIPDCAF